MMYRKPLVSESFKVPDSLITDNFVLRPLTIDYVDLDYRAVMQSVDAKGNLDINPNHTEDQNLIDLAWHQKEFQKKSSFAYTVLLPDESKSIGCVYIYPCDDSNYDAEVFMWVTKEAFEKGLDPIVFSKVKQWLSDLWSFKNVKYEGRE